MLAHLRKAVQESGVSQVEIATRLGRTEAYVSKVLRGAQVLTLIEIRLICQAANIPFVRWVEQVDAVLTAKAPGVSEPL